MTMMMTPFSCVKVVSPQATFFVPTYICMFYFLNLCSNTKNDDDFLEWIQFLCVMALLHVRRTKYTRH